MNKELALEDLRGLDLHHLGYKVDDINASVKAWNQLGVGPFFVLRNLEFDALETEGSDDGVFEHSAAFAYFGNTGIELQEITAAEPESLNVKLGNAGPDRLNHVAYAVDDPNALSERLAEAGYPKTLYTRGGPIEDYMHFVPELEQMIELHLASDALENFWGNVKRENLSWDGSEGLRPAEPLMR